MVLMHGEDALESHGVRVNPRRVSEKRAARSGPETRKGPVEARPARVVLPLLAPVLCRRSPGAGAQCAPCAAIA